MAKKKKKTRPAKRKCGMLALFAVLSAVATIIILGINISQIAKINIPEGLPESASFENAMQFLGQGDTAATATTTTSKSALLQSFTATATATTSKSALPKDFVAPATKTTTESAQPDGTFNGYPVYYREETGIETFSHCVGNSYEENTAWMHRSCKFQFFCFDTGTKDFVVYRNLENDKKIRDAVGDSSDMYSYLNKLTFIDASQSYFKRAGDKANTVSLGGINGKWTKKGWPRVEWFPEIRNIASNEKLSFYELPPNVVMIPFHSFNGENPGHIVWDDFLPIYTLLKMFQLEGNENDLMMMRYVLKLKKDERALWATCDLRLANRLACEKMQRKFLPLMMGLNPIHKNLTSTENFIFQQRNAGSSSDKDIKPNLICAKNGVAGTGALTDHGTKKSHGWLNDDYKIIHNHGRGAMLYDFRNYMVKNMDLPLERIDHLQEQQELNTTKPKYLPFRIVFSIGSSRRKMRGDVKRLNLLKDAFDPDYVSVESYTMNTLTIKEQLEIASQTSIFVTLDGGGAVTASFLPKGSSVILYFFEDGGLIENSRTGDPARLDWDLFNNLSYLKVHWLPAKSMLQQTDINAFKHLVYHELHGLMRERCGTTTTNFDILLKKNKTSDKIGNYCG